MRSSALLLLAALAAPALPARGAAQARPFGSEATFTPHTDSFTVQVRGTPLGYRRVELSRMGGGWWYVDVMQIGAFVLQRTEITLGADGVVRQVLQGGQVQGIDIRTSLQYQRGRVRGVTVAPSGGKGVTINVDTAVTPGTIDDNAIPLYLPALAWGQDTAWSFTAFVSGENAFHLMRLRITGDTAVTVPAGTFDVWLAELDGGPAPVRFAVTKAAPHRVVREELVGTPIEFLLVR